MADLGIVMPLYIQNPLHLKQAIHSVLTQQYRNFVFTIVVDGAPKKYLQLARKFVAGDPRVRFIYYKKNKGIAHALNTGFNSIYKLPGIKYLTWVSSDNIYDGNFLKRLRHSLQESPPSVGLVYGSYRRITQSGASMEKTVPSRVVFNHVNQPPEYLLHSCIVGGAFMYRKSVALKTGKYRMDPVQDYDYWLRMTEICKMKFVPAEVMSFRVGAPHSLTTQINGQKEKFYRSREMAQRAVYEARLRRGIKADIAIVYPVQNVRTDTQKIDLILNQKQNIFDLYLVDVNGIGLTDGRIGIIHDPRIKVISDSRATHLSDYAKSLPYRHVIICNHPMNWVDPDWLSKVIQGKPARS